MWTVNIPPFGELEVDAETKFDAVAEYLKHFKLSAKRVRFFQFEWSDETREIGVKALRP